MCSELLEASVPSSRVKIPSIIVVLAIALLVLALALLSMAHVLPSFAVIETTSMVPTLLPGDLVIIYGGEECDVGDIVAFNIVVYRFDDYGNPIDVRRIPLTIHRIINKTIIGGQTYFITKGDNNFEPDPWYVPEHGIVGKVEKIASLGKFGLTLASPIGKALLMIMLVSAIVLLSSIVWDYLKGASETLKRYV